MARLSLIKHATKYKPVMTKHLAWCSCSLYTVFVSVPVLRILKNYSVLRSIHMTTGHCWNGVTHTTATERLWLQVNIIIAKPPTFIRSHYRNFFEVDFIHNVEEIDMPQLRESVFSQGQQELSHYFDNESQFLTPAPSHFFIKQGIYISDIFVISF